MSATPRAPRGPDARPGARPSGARALVAGFAAPRRAGEQRCDRPLDARRVESERGAQAGRIAGIYYSDDLIAAPFAYADGYVMVPQGPGMGIDVDTAKVEKYRVATLD